MDNANLNHSSLPNLWDQVDEQDKFLVNVFRYRE